VYVVNVRVEGIYANYMLLHPI